MPLSNIVNVQISRETKAVAQASFSVIAVVGANVKSGAPRLSYCSTLAEVAALLTNGVNSPEYYAAQAIFSQNPRVTQIAIGKKAAGDTDWTTCLNAIEEYNSNWYGLIANTRVAADQKEIADWVASNGNKFFMCASQDVNIANDPAETTSIAYYIKGLNARAACIYHTQAGSSVINKAPDAAALGRIFPLDPGSYTLKFKNLGALVPLDTLTTTQENTILDKNCGFYSEVGGVSMVQEGKTGEGEWIDVIIFCDWLKSRITESVFGLLANAKKVPYDDSGIQSIVAKIAKPLQDGINAGGLTKEHYNDAGEQDGGFVITAPRAQDISPNDKANRVLNNVYFTAWLAGAIHATTIQGTVTY